jgi:hypothetical protein
MPTKKNIIRKNITYKKDKKNKKTKKVFSRKDYYSKDGMMTRIWGPPAWHFLHTISFNYPDNPTAKQKDEYRDYVLSMGKVLPCGKCRDNFSNNLKQLPLLKKHLKNRNTFSRYIYNLHELVNKMLKKNSGLTFYDVRDRYESFRARCKEPTQNITTEIGCVLPENGKKNKCVLKIVPEETRCDSFQM